MNLIFVSQKLIPYNNNHYYKHYYMQDVQTGRENNSTCWFFTLRELVEITSSIIKSI